MTEQDGWINHKHCFLDAVIIGINTEKIVVRLVQKVWHMPQSISVFPSQLQRVRDVTLDHDYKIGEKVHVREVIETIVGWWEATIIGKVSFADGTIALTVCWDGEYEDFRDTAIVDPRNVRLADYPAWENIFAANTNGEKRKATKKQPQGGITRSNHKKRRVPPRKKC